VIVVMASYNGAKYIAEQLESIARQTVRPKRVVVFDDGSTDGTQDIVRRRSVIDPTVELVQNPQRLGFAANFLNGLTQVNDHESAIAFADQDDIWLTRKLQRALETLVEVPKGVPAIYASRQRIVDEAGRFRRPSPNFQGPFVFENALVQNVVTGCTAVLNARAVFLLTRASWPGVPYHDWFAYQLVSGAGGVVKFDREAYILYRQHGASTIGAPGLISRYCKSWARIRTRQTRRQVDAQLAALCASRSLLTDRARQDLSNLVGYRSADLSIRLRQLRELRGRRQTRLDTSLFRLLVLAGLW
jgi:glycosyltransferase involved in cell wall biosynthesis